MADTHTNRLAQSSSPYLQQHKHNPVDWYPWGDEAFDRAKAENKLVLVSIGYSACHWCHVMERETFEDHAAAALMNQHFVCVKVDREERPDVDQVYMTAVQLMTQQGGWPLNCFTLPDGRPVYGGTYFKREAFMEVLEMLANLHAESPNRVTAYADQLTEAIDLHERIQAATSIEHLPSDLTAQLVDRWRPHWDRERGGLDYAPKFPMPNNWAFLLEHGALVSDADATAHAHRTLLAQVRSGMADQIGGGYARYSVDALWKVPHFEKMLYDNGQLLSAFARAHAHVPTQEYARAVAQTAAWLDRELRRPDGWYQSALDADSEGEEGKHYTWTQDELESLWGEDWPWGRQYFSIDTDGFWEHGQYIPLRTEGDAQFAARMGWTLDTFYPKLDALMDRTLEARNVRVFPGLDHKVLVSWNAYAVQGLAVAGRVFQRAQYSERAQNLALLMEDLYSARGSFPHTLDSPGIGFLEDHAATAQAWLEVYRTTQDEQWVTHTGRLLEQTWKDFADSEGGMPWFTAHSGEHLVSRKQENFDNVTPASSSMLAHACLDYGLLTGNPTWTGRARALMANMVSEMGSVQNTSHWALLLDRLTRPYYHVVIAGPGKEAALADFDTQLHPNTLVSLAHSGTILAPVQGKASEQLTFYVCIEGACQRPVHTLEDALAQLA